jgi:ABC-2 type transport system ATP-binding protein
MITNTVEVNNLSRQFRQTLALDNISFRAEQGRIYGLVGANGAGKTTLIKHLLGLFRVKSSGSVRIFGLDPVRHPVDVLKRIGYLSEDRELPEWMNIDELMRYTRAYHPGWDEQYARELLSTFQLDRSMKIKDLSKGMRAQAALVAAVAHRPDLLLLDEPSSGLDVMVREDILEAIVRTITDDGRTVVFSSHLLEEVERMSDHVTMIHQGRITLDGTLDKLQDNHQLSQLQFDEKLNEPPVFNGALSMEGSGYRWRVIHDISAEHGSTQNLQASVTPLGGRIVQSRNASLQEIFVARVSRDRLTQELV